MSDLVETSKFLSYVLRHHPEAIELELEPGGWAEIDELIEGARKTGHDLDRQTLEAVVAHSDKDRFSFDDEARRIRANYGHSIEVDLGLEASRPPERLCHGTSRSALGSIRSEGLVPKTRQWVHLQECDEGGRETARQVGARHGRPVVLEIATERVDAPFYRSESGIWLVEHVPPEAIIFPSDS